MKRRLFFVASAISAVILFFVAREAASWRPQRLENFAEDADYQNAKREIARTEAQVRAKSEALGRFARCATPATAISNAN